MAESSGGGGSGSSTGSVTDLGGWIKKIFGEKGADGVKSGIKEYKDMEKDYGGSAISATGSSSGSSSLNKPMELKPMKAGSLGWESGFYGHYLPKHFKKTNIISTKGRVR